MTPGLSFSSVSALSKSWAPTLSSLSPSFLALPRDGLISPDEAKSSNRGWGSRHLWSEVLPLGGSLLESTHGSSRRERAHVGTVASWTLECLLSSGQKSLSTSGSVSALTCSLLSIIIKGMMAELRPSA